MFRRRGFRLLATTLLVGPVTLTGCQAAGPVAAVGPRPDFTTLLKLPGSEAAVMRGQKPAGGPQKSMLELVSAVEPNARAARIRATVNGEAILDEEVNAAAFQGLATARTEAEKADILNQKLNEIIERELLIQDATARLSKRGGTKFLQELESIGSREFDKQWLHKLMRVNNVMDEATFVRMLRDQGMSVEQMRRQWVRNFISMEYLRTRIEPNLNRVGHLDIVEYYDRHPDEFKVDDAVVWQDIFIATARHPSPQAAKQFAEVLAERIRKGEDFVRLAKEFDNGDSSLRENAEGIGRKRGEINPPAAEDLLFRLKDGEVGPLIEIETGYHIVRLSKRTKAGKKPFDDQVQKQIRDKLKNQVFQLEMRKMINELKGTAIIEVAGAAK